MHGDKTLPDEAVFCERNYEAYDTKRSLFLDKLRGDLLNKTFCFWDFSLQTHNIDYILSRIRILLVRNQRRHYCIRSRLQSQLP